MTSDLFLIVEGFRYAGWKSIRVTRSIEGLAGAFDLDVSDRWGPDDPWPITEGDPCRVEINGQVVINGYVDKRKLGGSATTRTLSYSGRDRAADLVDCSMLVADGASIGAKGHKWTYRNLDIAQFATAIAAQHDIRVSVQPGLVLKKDPILVAHPGETGFEAIKRAAGSAGVLVVSDGAGGIIITRAGTARAAPLVEGDNILTAEIECDATDRFHRYLISSQPPGDDDASGEATRVLAEATDLGVARENRILLIRPDKGYDAATSKRRADWEARIRAAKAETATISVRGWTQPNGDLWPLNVLTRVVAPRMIGIDGDMLISQVEYSMGEGGSITQLHLVRRDAFEPEPQTAIVGTAHGWAEILHGGDAEPVRKR